jgi:hypothetical protein
MMRDDVFRSRIAGHGRAADQAMSPWIQLIPFALVLAHLLFRDSFADEAAAEEGAGVPRRPQDR